METIGQIIAKVSDELKCLKGIEQKVTKLHGINNESTLNKHKKLWSILAGKDYNYTENNRKIITGLIYYFNGNYISESEFGISLNKGIFICGEPGCGKSTIFKIFHNYLKYIANPNPNLYRQVSVEEIISSHRTNLDANQLTYNLKENIYGKKEKSPINICINEFASNYDAKIYGTDVNEIMDSFYMKRYEVFQQFGKLTHATSNFDIQDISNMFRIELVDRFKEMFNIIELKGKSFRN
jgi:predicted ATPase